jgi:hypothetical protein
MGMGVSATIYVIHGMAYIPRAVSQLHVEEQAPVETYIHIHYTLYTITYIPIRVTYILHNIHTWCCVLIRHRTKGAS